MHLVVDGVFFQLNNTGIARVWQTILGIIAARGDFEITLLDRGGVPEIDGVNRISFPAYKAADVAADSIMIQHFCDLLKADVFTTTYYSTPLTTPMALMVYDMIPELFDFDMSLRGWMEKETAISYAQRYLCISHNTKRDLLKIYDEIREDHVGVAYCGVDTATFFPKLAKEISNFRERHELHRPYFLFVGSRVQHNSYKNSNLFFDALPNMATSDFDIFCVGGEKEIEATVLDRLPAGVSAQRVTLTDHELSLAYGGAIALVYPSLYEGFGMPVIEAMASGCPVITTQRGSLAEAAGDAALLVEGTSVPEMTAALNRIQDPAIQADLRTRGLDHAAGFRWEPMADLFCEKLQEAVDAGSAPATQEFFAEWSRLRRLQSQVDYK
ncbi:glycosyltransferase family 4 protein [Hyphobacterium sp.]|uniref:glycosyltransferase family 4 protein n=1 Tax=Hyphobacterium sp. TaxID=2004662 RepID=UPI0037481673